MKLEHIVELKGEIEVVTGLHIGAGDLEMRIGGVDNAVIRNPRDNAPYIPGSSLKGKIRSLLEWRSGAVRPEPLRFSDYDKAASPMKSKVLEILQLFGVGGGDELDDKQARLVGPTRVSFQDAMMASSVQGDNRPLTEVKSENMIDRIKGVAKNPRQTERVAAGVGFQFRATVRQLTNDPDLVQTLLHGMRLLELDSLGGSGSRGYGKVRFRGLTRDGKDIQKEFEAIDPFARSGASGN